MRKEQDFRHNSQNELIKIEQKKAHVYEIAQKARNKEAIIGQFFAFIIGMTGIIASSYLIYHDQPWTGSGIGLGALGTIVLAHIRGRNKDE
ncbi:hypothetical protein [Fangia hongkongensis]|uniref:hypothetical protein n=1 Tax=Fangia hongkongensis TaxID=270495 RepID=UPI00036FA7C6|nr:hypothetical protein [Fangia hongkongensis]MBK2125739.1 hypothetical protein [Fangia hongkongensis]